MARSLYVYTNRLEQELISDEIDFLKEFKELDGYDVHSVDGHYIEHSSHTQRDVKGKLYASGNLYALNMRNGLMQHFAFVSDGSEKNHEMPIFREGMKKFNKEKKTIWIGDMAFVDYRWWGKQAKEGNHVISKVKTNSSILYCGDLSFDKTDTVNAGVVSDRLGGTTSSGYTIRVIEYIDPETEEKIIFYSTLDKSVRPGVISWLYFLRWKIEKVFDCFKKLIWGNKSMGYRVVRNCVKISYMIECVMLLLFSCMETKKDPCLLYKRSTIVFRLALPRRVVDYGRHLRRRLMVMAALA